MQVQVVPPGVRFSQCIAACTAVLYGTVLGIYEDRYKSPIYEVAFEIAHPRWWAVLFIVSGVLTLGALLGPRPVRWAKTLHWFGAVCCGVLAAVMTGWSAALLTAVFTPSLGVGTVAGPITWMSIAAINTVLTTRYGTGRGVG